MNDDLIQKLKDELLRRAEARFPGQPIGPAGKKAHLSECYTMEMDTEPDSHLLIFWYNVGQDTHAEMVKFRHVNVKKELQNGGNQDDGGKENQGHS